MPSSSARLEHAGFFHPGGERVVRLRREVDEDAPAGLVDGGLDDRVERLDLVDRHRRGVAGVEAHQRAVRAVGVEAEEGQLLVDQVLRQHARHQRFADAAFFAADEMDVSRRHEAIVTWPACGATTSIVFSTTLPATLHGAADDRAADRDRSAADRDRGARRRAGDA